MKLKPYLCARALVSGVFTLLDQGNHRGNSGCIAFRCVPKMRIPADSSNLRRAVCAVCASLVFMPFCGTAQQSIQGALSGTLPKGRYFAAGDLSVAAGQTLRIEAGAVLEFPSNVTFTVSGTLQAEGSPEDAITFRPRIVGQAWKGIHIASGSAPASVRFCIFKDAEIGLDLSIYSEAGEPVMGASIVDSTFEGCSVAGVRGTANGGGFASISGFRRGYPFVSPDITRCTFRNMPIGCAFQILGSNRGGCCPPPYGAGRASPEIQSCTFVDVDSALRFFQLDRAGSGSKPVFANNLVIRAVAGVVAPSLVDAAISRNIFIDCAVAVKKDSETLSDSIEGNVMFVPNDGIPGLFGGRGFVPSDTYGKTTFGFKWGRYPADPFRNVFLDTDALDAMQVVVPPLGADVVAPTVVFSWMQAQAAQENVEISETVSGPWRSLATLWQSARPQGTRVIVVMSAGREAEFVRGGPLDDDAL